MNIGNVFRFSLINGSVFICGVAEGMLLPLIASLLEAKGVPAVINGAGTTALYIGMLISVPFMEKPMEKTGYKPFLFIGLMLITLSLVLFPVRYDLWFWFLLRLAVGLGDSMLHFAAQTWITVDSPRHKKGTNIAIYGLCFGTGFAAGPLLVRLTAFGTAVPFLTAAALCLIFLLPLLLLKNEYPKTAVPAGNSSAFVWTKRYRAVILAAWSGLAATFGFGFLDATLNNSFPIFALRNGFALNDISLLLPLFSAGGLLTQLPIGMIGDRIGRRKTMPLLSSLGAAAFLFSGLFYFSYYGLLASFLAAGLLVGSLYSMSMSYVSDMLDKPLIPLGNILMTISYSIGCMTGPIAGSLLIGLVPRGGLFYGISAVLFLVAAGCLIHQRFRSRKIAAADRVRPA